MSNQSPAFTPDNPNRHRPYVPENMEMKELTPRAVLLGLCMTVVLGAANAYLGLRAGITIAATYPAAVIAMAVIRAWKGTLLEENIARTAGSIGEGIACQSMAFLPARGCVLEIDGLNHGGQHFGSAVHFTGPPGNGGRSRTAIS